MELERLLNLIAAARNGDLGARDELLAANRSFIHQSANRISGRTLRWENDDELSVALMAFNEAIDKYGARGGAGFLTYAGTVIRYRLLDFYRREARGPKTLPLEVDLDDDQTIAPGEIREAQARYQSEEDEARTAEEIDIMLAELRRYGMGLEDLVAASPKHRDTKATLLRVVATLLSRPDLLEHLHRTHQLPLKELENATGVSRKVLESGRRYIVAVTIVMRHPDLERVRAHIRLPGCGGGD